MSEQVATPVVIGDSSPLTAAKDASSMSEKPSDVSPVAILSAPSPERADALRSGLAADWPMWTARSASSRARSMSPVVRAISLWARAR